MPGNIRLYGTTGYVELAAPATGNNATLTLPFTIEAASEYALDESVIQKANNKTLLTLKENYVLVELS